MEAFTDTLPMLYMGLKYGSIYRHFTNVVHGLYVSQRLYICVHVSDTLEPLYTFWKTCLNVSFLESRNMYKNQHVNVLA